MKKKYLSQENVENYINIIYLNIIEANWKPDIILSINIGKSGDEIMWNIQTIGFEKKNAQAPSAGG